MVISMGLWNRKRKFQIGICASAVIICLQAFPARAEQDTIEQAWVSAYQNNPSLEAERAKLRATDEQVAQALSHWRPSFDVNAGVTRTWQHTPSDSGVPASEFAKNGDTYGGELKQPLFRGFRTVAETDAAEEQVKAGRAQLQSAEQQLLLDTGKAFLDTLRDEIILANDRDEENVLQKKLDEVSERARLGDLTKTDVRQAETRLARAQVTRLQAENTLVADRATYLRLVGVEAGSLAAPSLAFDQKKGLDEALHRAETINPTVIAAQHAVEAAKHEIDLNKGGLLPEVNLVGSSSNAYGQNITFPRRGKQRRSTAWSWRRRGTRRMKRRIVPGNSF
jgi:outer membrane protein